MNFFWQIILTLVFSAGAVGCVVGYARLWWRLYVHQGLHWRAAKLPGAAWTLGGWLCGAAIWAVWVPAVLNVWPLLGLVLLFLAWLGAETLTSSYYLAEKQQNARGPKNQPPL